MAETSKVTPMPVMETLLGNISNRNWNVVAQLETKSAVWLKTNLPRHSRPTGTSSVCFG